MCREQELPYHYFKNVGSAYPLDELKHAGVDFSTPEPVSRALTKFSQILDDVEETLKKL